MINPEVGIDNESRTRKSNETFELKEAYQQKRLTPRKLVAHIRETIKTHQHNPIWIYCLNDKELEPYLARLENNEQRVIATVWHSFCY